MTHAAPDRRRKATARLAACRSRQSLPLLLLPAALAAWAAGLARTTASYQDLGTWGLLPLLSPLAYAGVALLVISAGLELARPRVSSPRLAAHTVALVVMLYGTAAIIYPEPRFSWLYKTAGVIQYVKVNGHLTPGIDIYMNWPGFFALAAWFERVAGVSSTLAYAKWAQVAFELAAIPLLWSVYTSLRLTRRQRWVAILAYFTANWIGQDYLSPQAVALLLSLGVMAIVLRWLPAPGAVVAPPRPDDTDPDDAQPDSAVPAGLAPVTWPAGAAAGGTGPAGGERARRAVALAVALGLAFVLVFTHEISPYMIAVQIGALAVLRQVRPAWLPLAVLAISIGFLLPNLSYVNQRYGLLASFGDFFANILSPSAGSGGVEPASQLLLAHAADLLSAGVWGLALIGAWLMRASRRRAFALLVMTFSPVVVLVGGAYGNEGILRVYLFSLPWAVALGATALTPFRPGELIPARLRRRLAARDAAPLPALAGAPLAAASLDGRSRPSPLAAFGKALPAVLTQTRAEPRLPDMTETRADLRLPAVTETRAELRLPAGATPPAPAQPVPSGLPPWPPSVAGPAAPPPPDLPPPDLPAPGGLRAGARRALAPALALAAALVLFLPVEFGDDSATVYPPSEITSLSAFFAKAQAGPVLCMDADAPLFFTARYSQFPMGVVFGDGGIMTASPASTDVAAYLARTVVNYNDGESPAYVLFAPSMTKDVADYGDMPASYLPEAAASMRSSKYWKLLVNDDGTQVYEITGAANDISLGPYTSYLGDYLLVP